MMSICERLPSIQHMKKKKVLRQIVFAHKRSKDLYFSLTICLEIPRAVTDSRRSCAVAIVDSNRRGELARKENKQNNKKKMDKRK